MKVWVCVTKPGNWRRVKKGKVFGLSQHAANLVGLVKRGDIVLVYVLKPTYSIVGVYQVRSVLEGTKGLWDDRVYPFGIELESAEDFKKGIKPISLSSLIGVSNKNVDVSPFLKGVSIFEVPSTVLEKLKTNRNHSYDSKLNCRYRDLTL